MSAREHIATVRDVLNDGPMAPHKTEAFVALTHLLSEATLHTQALQAGRNYLSKLSDPMCPPAVRQVALDDFADRIALAEEAAA